MSSGPSHQHCTLVANLRASRNIVSERVEAAMMRVDRANYVDKNPYYDQPQIVGWNATISAPHIHAMALEFLHEYLRPGADVLDIGCGSGYLTACFGVMVKGVPNGRVTGVDHIEDLVLQAKNNIKKDNPELLKEGIVDLVCRDGRYRRDEKQYDVIHVGAAALGIPKALLDSLKPGGRMLIPVGEDKPGGEQPLLCVDKQHDGSAMTKRVAGVRCMALCDMEQQLGHPV